VTPEIRLALEIEDPRWTVALPDIAALLERAIGFAVGEAASGSRPIEVGVRMVDDGTIAGLNRDWRGRDRPTNVLSFPIGDPVPVPDPTLPWLIGDIVMAYETVTREALNDRKPLGHHVAHLAIHGALHLLGRDHESDEEAEAMEAAEVALLRRLDIPDPYAPDLQAPVLHADAGPQMRRDH
jgi:probable rRNA maturation factor